MAEESCEFGGDMHQAQQGRGARRAASAAPSRVGFGGGGRARGSGRSSVVGAGRSGSAVGRGAARGGGGTRSAAIAVSALATCYLCTKDGPVHHEIYHKPICDTCGPLVRGHFRTLQNSFGASKVIEQKAALIADRDTWVKQNKHIFHTDVSAKGRARQFRGFAKPVLQQSAVRRQGGVSKMFDIRLGK